MTDPVVVALPVSRVTVLEDRAQVERRGTVTVPAGRATLRVEKVSAAVVDRSLRAEVVGATLVDARVVRVWEEKRPGGLPADATELRTRVQSLERELEGREADVARLAVRFAVAQKAYAAVLRQIAEFSGAGKADAGRFEQSLGAVRNEEAAVAEARRVAARARERTEHRLAEARAALGRSEEPLEDLETSLELVVEGTGGEVRLTLGYLVPCAVWRPAYRATLGPERDGARTVRVEAEAVVWQRTGEEWGDVELAFSTARPTLGTEPAALSEDRLSLRDKTQQEKQGIQVAIREEEIQSAGEGGTEEAAEMPGLDDGGEVQLIPAPARASIPPDGQPYRVPLFAFDAPARAELVAAPEHSPLVSLVARLENRGGRVLLAGPVDLVRESGFVGRGQLKFTAPGEVLKLSFGSEDALRVVREVVVKREESRLTGKRTTTRTVRLFVSNAGGEAAPVAVQERVPVSEVSAVEVKVLADRSSPRPEGPSGDGIVRFKLDLPPRSRREVTLVYELTASGKVSGL